MNGAYIHLGHEDNNPCAGLFWFLLSSRRLRSGFMILYSSGILARKVHFSIMIDDFHHQVLKLIKVLVQKYRQIAYPYRSMDQIIVSMRCDNKIVFSTDVS